MVSTKYKKNFQKMELKKFGIFNPKWSEPLEVFPTRQKADEALIDAFDHRDEVFKQTNKECKCMDCLQSGIYQPDVCYIKEVA
tara:strand:+ start:1077 stop:1325 length:249 start_codon:yes stop_codon:yes gene_type:complete